MLEHIYNARTYYFQNIKGKQDKAESIGDKYTIILVVIKSINI